MSSRITSVIFDFGGVLGLHQDPAQAKVMADLCGLPTDRFHSLYATDRLEWDRATQSAAEYWGSILAAAGRAPTDGLVSQLVRADVAAWTRINDRVVAWAAALRRRGFRTAILSNMPQEILNEMWRDPRLQWMAQFDARVFSCEVHLVKPEAAIYRLCLEKLAAQPAQTVFLDDVAHNVEGAAAVGIQGLLFISAQEAAGEIEQRWGLPVEELRGGGHA
jgi:putative hydrolase of the HAD superfamily